MITEQALQEAIAECNGERNPNSSTCLKLAAFYTIKDHLYPEQQETPQKSVERTIPVYSYSSGVENEIGTFGDTEFALAIAGRSAEEIWPIIIELMDVLHTINPRLYAGVMRKIDT